ncbi:MAG: transcription termination/antitermination protein NusG [Oscillospiraceae bacterium]|nr:transcription termination/antitermination protein NusG [Oscillospiraceae bacterium]
MSSEAKWYVVHTYSGYENKVAATIEKTVENRKLHDLIYEVTVPTEIVEEIKDGARKQVERKVFPSYVLVKMVMTDESWYIVRNTRGVTGFLGSKSDPVPLTEEEVLALGVEKHEVVVDYEVGDSVKIIDGALEDFIATVDEIELEKNKIRVIVSMFGRETSVELEPDQVELVKE